MEEREYLITNCEMPLIDADITPEGHIAAIIQQNETYRLCVNGTSLATRQDLRFPLVRMSDAGYVLLAETWAERHHASATLINLHTMTETHFSIGTGVLEIVLFQHSFAVTYIDQVYGSRDGLYGFVMFDLRGDPLWHDAGGVIDCYCACAQDAGHCLYLCYPDFILKQLDVKTLQLREWRIPQALHGAAAMTSLDDTVFFHAPYQDRSGLYRWRFDAKVAKRIGAYTAPLRGVSNGRFLAKSTTGLVELSMKDMID